MNHNNVDIVSKAKIVLTVRLHVSYFCFVVNWERWQSRQLFFCEAVVSLLTSRPIQRLALIIWILLRHFVQDLKNEAKKYSSIFFSLNLVVTTSICWSLIIKQLFCIGTLRGQFDIERSNSCVSLARRQKPRWQSTYLICEAKSAKNFASVIMRF